MKPRKLLEKIISGSRDISFKDMMKLVESFGFHLSRVKGSHHIFAHPEVSELINLQNMDGKAKPYQIRQFLQLVERYHLDLGEKR
ncbi:type II toxin-antitoxin system HicA family toxin [bacterium]|nr:type II toxin-antitoxin system HicA family toxin [bacterium]MBU1024442.1 type II toxin-antitoxin system HicA family toxin [bacterium]